MKKIILGVATLGVSYLLIDELVRASKEKANSMILKQKQKEIDQLKKHSYLSISKETLKGKQTEELVELREMIKKKEKLISNRIEEIAMELSEEKNCIVCLKNKKEVLFLPCNHFYCCSQCSEKLQACPVCRGKIADKRLVIL